MNAMGLNENDSEERYNRAVELVIRDNSPSPSYLQRIMQIGYNQAARFIEEMEKRGIVSEANHIGKREVLK